jgi:hypothetical protein
MKGREAMKINQKARYVAVGEKNKGRKIYGPPEDVIIPEEFKPQIENKKSEKNDGAIKVGENLLQANWKTTLEKHPNVESANNAALAFGSFRSTLKTAELKDWNNADKIIHLGKMDVETEALRRRSEVLERQEHVNNTTKSLRLDAEIERQLKVANEKHVNNVRFDLDKMAHIVENRGTYSQAREVLREEEVKDVEKKHQLKNLDLIWTEKEQLHKAQLKLNLQKYEQDYESNARSHQDHLDRTKVWTEIENRDLYEHVEMHRGCIKGLSKAFEESTYEFQKNQLKDGIHYTAEENAIRAKLNHLKRTQKERLEIARIEFEVEDMRANGPKISKSTMCEVRKFTRHNADEAYLSWIKTIHPLLADMVDEKVDEELMRACYQDMSETDLALARECLKEKFETKFLLNKGYPTRGDPMVAPTNEDLHHTARVKFGVPMRFVQVFYREEDAGLFKRLARIVLKPFYTKYVGSEYDNLFRRHGVSGYPDSEHGLSFFDDKFYHNNQLFRAFNLAESQSLLVNYRFLGFEWSAIRNLFVSSNDYCAKNKLNRSRLTLVHPGLYMAAHLKALGRPATDVLKNQIIGDLSEWLEYIPSDLFCESITAGIQAADILTSQGSASFRRVAVEAK